MSKAFTFALGLLAIVSLGFSSALAGGGPDPEQMANDAAATAYEETQGPREGLPVSIPGDGPPKVPTFPVVPSVPLPGDGGGTPQPPAAPTPDPDDAPAPPELPNTPGPGQAAEQVVARATSTLSPIESTAVALGDAALYFIAGGLESGSEMMRWVGTKADHAGADAAATASAVLSMLLAEPGSGDDPGRHARGGPLDTAAAATNVIDGTNRLAVVALFALGSMSAAFAGFALLRRLISLGAVALLSRIPSKDIMKNGTRAAVFEIVQTDPGVSLNEIVERLGVSRNAVAYHLAVFEQETTMVSIKDGKYRRYFVNGGKFANGAKVVVSAIRNDITRNVAAFIAQHPGVIQKDVCAAVGTSPSATNWHIGRLERVGLVAKQKVANTVQYQPGPSLAKYDLSAFGLQATADAVA